MKRIRLPGLSEIQQRQLFQALIKRSELDHEARLEFPVPEPLAHTFLGQGWWALLKELYDRPLMTTLGFTAATTYPLFLLMHLLHRWI
ncbi:MAG: hypothetical protein G3I10_04025 [Ferrovum sp.]|nr:hypothetical protein [Ferrovum sp.]